MKFSSVRCDASVALVVIAFGAASLITGCGGSSAGSGSVAGSGGGSGNTSTTIQYKVTGATPSVAALQVNGGAWTALALSGSNATFTVPTATSNYAVAVLCPVASGRQEETVYETSASDTVSPTSSCAPTATVTTNVTYNVSAFSGLNAQTTIGGYGTVNSPASSSSVNVTSPTGTQDVGILTYNIGNAGYLGIEIKRGINITGAPITISPMTTSDATGIATVVVNGIPSGYTNSFSAGYLTAGGAAIPLNVGNSANYALVAAGDTQTGDSYLIWPIAYLPTGGVEAQQSFTSGQNTTLTYPALFTYNGPTAAAYPIFNATYNGFTISAKTGWFARISWVNGATTYGISVNATSAFLGSNPISIPNLSSIPGFPTPQTSGGTVTWSLTAMAQTIPYFRNNTTPPVNENAQYAKAIGSYVEP